MKTITKNLLAFSLGFVVLTIVFRFSLSSMLQNRLFGSVWLAATIYGILIFIIGILFNQVRLALGISILILMVYTKTYYVS